MDKFKVNQNAWHYKFAKFSLGKIFTQPKDFCSYWRMVFVWSPLMLLLYSIMLLGIFVHICMIGYFIYTDLPTAGIVVIIVSIVFGITTIIKTSIKKFFTWLATTWLLKGIGWAVKFIVITCIGSIVGLIVVTLGNSIIYLYNKIRPKKSTRTRQPSIIYTKYKSLKEKYCPMVEYVGKE